MSIYQFKLPDVGEGIAEAEIVAWHIKLGDRVEEDQQLADMMTDKATVEMESPVAGTVVKLAGEVGDQIAIGSVLVEIETESSAAGAESKDEQPLGDGSVKATEAMAEEIPTSATADQPPPARAGGEEREARRGGPVALEHDKPSPGPSHSGGRGEKA
ncbi:MAG: 2-oxo acid dehydrogenase subunit E2, partial [Pseudomonadota bacterium]|nr:2-oxo acid dehydrogenase subunit E2 [Pseudomonadota bacterium]